MVKEKNKKSSKRSKMIQDIEKSRNSRLICYITGDRKPFNTKIADDVIPIFAKHLEKIGKQRIISFFLYTRGGDMITPIRLIKLIRSYAERVEIIVPYRAHSAGTLIAIGADKIVMGRLGELSPVDPTTGHPFNPQNPNNQQQRMEISVEDLNSYFLLAKDKAGVKDKDMVEIYKQLAEKIHPLAIGNIYRAARMARQIAEKLLNMHIDKEKNKQKIKKIVDELTGNICIHAYPIMRDEAKDLDLNIEYADGKLGKQVWQLYENYAEEMELKEPFNPAEKLGNSELINFDYTGACIESRNLVNKFIFKIIIERNKSPLVKSAMWR